METVTELLSELARNGVKLSAAAGQLNCFSPKGSLTSDMKAGILKHKPALIALLEGVGKKQKTQAGIGVVREPPVFPLSAGQKGLYILQTLHPEMSAYNVPLCFRIRGAFNAELMAKAWGYVLEQFPILTARVIERDGALYQLLDENCKTTIQQREGDFADDQELLSFVRGWSKEPFDLNQGPLTRIELFTRDDQNAVLLLTVHHIVFDGTSAMILLASLLTFYQQLSEGRSVRLSHQLPGYQAFVAWEEAMLASEEGASHAAYWQEQLSGELPVLELLPELPRVLSPGFDGKTLVEELPETLSRWVLEYSKAQSLPPSVIFLALFQLVLHKYSGQDEIIVGMPVMGRAAHKFAADIGYFINMVPLRARCSEPRTLKEFLRNVQGTMLDALYHSSYPFPLMLESLQLGQARQDPVFRVSYAYQNFIKQPVASLRYQAVQIETLAGIFQEGDFELGLEIFENQDSFSVHLKYNHDVYTQDTVRKLFAHYVQLLTVVSGDPGLLVHEYSMITEQERQELIVANNDTRAGYPTDTCLHQLFVAQVAEHSDETAIICGDERLTYQELYARSRDLAMYLQSEGVEPDRMVGLCMARSLDMVVGLLSILQAGGAYVPLDPDYPDERLAYMLGDSQAVIVLTQERLRDRLAALVPADTRLVAVDRAWPEIRDRASALRADNVPLLQHVQPHHLAYVIYTSGSTGQPKGVAIEHHSPVTLVQWASEVYSREELAGVLASTSICFDLSVYEIFVTLANGGTIILVPNALGLITLSKEAAVTLINTVPSAMEELVRLGAIPASVKTINLAGEPLSPALVDKIYETTAARKVYDLYGPSEDTTYSTYVLRKKNGPRTIGRPIANTQVYILDSHQNPQPAGVAGELYIAGDGLARGYLNRPALTEERFIANPFQAGTRMYKTGDLARWLDDGTLQYLGRLDTQIKIRGYRIEMGEIEARLNQHPAIQDSAVIARGQDADRQLIAFYRTKDSSAEHIGELPNEELRTHLLRTLPDYMVPAGFVSLSAIPLTPNGKVDRRALAHMDVTMASGQAYVAPRNDTERQLIDIWAGVLNLAPAKIGINDNFFELGGHSLLATQLFSKIRGQLAVDLPLKALFDGGTVAQLAKLVAGSGKSDIPPIRPVDRTEFDRLPLSFAQERLWFLNELEPGNAGYNVPGAVTISGELDISHLERAFNQVIARHENLRTLFPSQDGQAHQRILDRVDFALERIDLSGYTAGDARDDEARRICRMDATTPFDLANGPLLRGKIIKLAEHEHILMLNMHHIISDGWSVGVLVKELGVLMEAFRQGRNPELPPLPIQYVDYSIWQRRWLEEGGILEQQLAYWQEKLAGAPESLDLIADYPRPNVQSFAGATHAFALSAQLARQLKRLADQQGGTLYMVLLAAFNVLLHRYTGQNDICVGSPIANRQYGETEGLIGMFVNTVAMRSQVEGSDSFAALLSKVKATCLEAYEHQDAPFEKVVDMLRPQRRMAITPLVQVMLILQNVDMGAPDAHIRRYPVDSGISKFDLTVEFGETPDGLAGLIEYSTALYKPQTIARLAEHFTALCQAIIVTPTAEIRELEFLGQTEKHRLLVDYNDTRTEYPKDRCLHELFVEQVALHPEKTALVCGQDQLTYQQLYGKSRDLALYLQTLGVAPDSLVCICMERSLDMVVGLVGVVQAGGAYVPLDPDYPDERLAYMLRDSGAAIVLTDRNSARRLRSLIARDTKLVTLDEDWPAILECAVELKASNVRLRREVKPYHLAYVIYTSGSTGEPKGVMVEHRNLANLVEWHRAAFELNERDVSTGIAGVGFDAAVWEIWPTLSTGGTLASPAADVLRDPEALLKWWETLRVDVSFLPTPLAEFAFSRRISNAYLRALLVGGDRLDQLPLQPEPFLLINNYGPTECTVVATSGVLEHNAEVLHIGRPISNTRIYILDVQRRLVPMGVAGEIYVAGAGVARGYLNRPELTEEWFLTDPFSSEPGARMYRTGDLARWLDDGNIQYLGRIDTQVKIRGFRIELGEIEARLKQHPEIQDSAVIARGQGSGKHLIAFYRAKETTAQQHVALAIEELRAHLLRTLPDYMVPAAFVSLAAIPLNPNGKVDRRALAQMDVTVASGREYVAPRNDMEKRLVDIWAEVLKLAPETIGVDDNFFELGGHSLLATQLISKIRSRLDVDVRLKLLFEQGSVGQFAASIATAQKSGIPPMVAVDRAQFEQFPLSFAQERLWFINQLEPDSAGYNVPGAVTISGELDVDQFEQAFNLIIARHESLRTVFPSQEGQARQRILTDVDFKIKRLDLSHYADGDARGQRARELCQAEASTPFDLANGPLIRGMVIKLAEREHILMLDMHHIISDGWSLGILIRELGVITDALRAGRRPELAPLAIQYADYSVWQRKWLEEGGVLEQQLAYWREKLAGVPESLELASDYARPSIQSFAGATQTFGLDVQLTEQLKRLAGQQGGTLYMVLLAAFKVLLHRYTGQDDICVGSPIANRQYGETEGLIGMFVNILALRSHVESEETFTALLAQVKNTCLEAYEHQDAPFEKVVDLLQPQRNLAISPLFQVTLTLQNTDSVTLNQSIRRYSLDSAISKFDLSLDFTETAAGLAASIEYSTALYKPTTIARMVEHFLAVCRAIVATPSARIRDLSYINEVEMDELAGFNDTRTDFPNGQCVHQLFVEQVERFSEKTAVLCGDEQLTYQELYARSRGLALYLQAEGVRPDSLVGVCMERSLDMVVSLLGILQAGGAYVPLDPDYPDERLAHMLRDSRAAIVLTQETLQGKLAPLLPEGTRLIALDRQWPEIDARVADLNAQNVPLLQEVEPHHLAYVIYTSGSTGRPKGVMNEHRGVVNRLLWMQRAYGLDMDDAVLQKTPFSFDVSVWEFFWPLFTGARLVMARPEGHKDPGYLVDTVRGNRITTLHFVPPMLQVFLEHADVSQCLSLTRVICSGEALPSTLVRRFIERLPHARLYNLYGPTEAAVDVTEWTCPTGEVPSIIPIGRPIANTQMYILDRHGAPVPIGVAGELHIGGVQVARGYLNRPALTAERFVPDPFAAEAGARMYKTGDLARWQDGGTIEFLGRDDFQVKIRGFRIELGEIEARLTEHEGVQEALVVAREDTPGEKRLVAYYTPSPVRALPVVQFLRLRKTEAGAAANHCTLPNGLTVFQQNQTETDFVYDEIFKDDGYLKHGVTLNDGDCVFDVGANIGLFSLFVSQRCRNATIYSFEPIPTVFQSLQLNSKLHGWSGKFYECGLAEAPGQQVFTFYPHNTVISSSATSRSEARAIVKSYLLKQQEGTSAANDQTAVSEDFDELLDSRLESEEFTCQLRTVSEIIAENAIERIDLLKIDVEKGEHAVLNGIQDGDWKKIQQLVVEVHDVSGRLAEIVSLLQGRGYEVSFEQSESLESTDLYNLYAFRAANGRSVRQAVPEKSWGSAEFLVRDVRAFLTERLPDYMVPAVYVPLDQMPLTPNGKLDRKALPAPEAGSVASHAYEPPLGEIEAALARVWSYVLKVERIGRNDNFFELGGHSLLATQLVSKIRNELDVDLPLKAVFERASVARLAEFIATAQKSRIPPIRAVDRSRFEPLPLSFAQERLWFLNELEPNSAGYNVPGAVTISGALDIFQLEEAFNLIIARHENLRTIFPSHEGRAHQRILDRLDFRLERIDLSHHTNGERRDNEAWELCQTDAATPFDLAKGPLIRGKVIKLAEQEHILMLNMHHIISDGWSLGVLIRELGMILEAFREGRPPELAPLPIQYADYSVWQRRWLEEGGILGQQLAYWQEKLAGVPESLELATDYPRPAVQTYAGATHPFALDAQLTGQLKRLGEQQGSTLYMVLLAAFKSLLHRYTGQSDICVGAPIANRQYGETEGLIGMFVNTLALRSQVEGDDSLITLLSKVRATCLDAYEHQDAPFEKVVDVLRLQRNLAISPLFQVVVILQNTEGGTFDSSIKLYPLDGGVSKSDLTAEFTETSNGLAGSIRYRTALFKPQTIARMAEHFTALCRAIIAAPAAEIRSLDYLSNVEKRTLVAGYNDTQADYPGDKCIGELFAEQAAISPDKEAVVLGEEKLTYQELLEKSRALAMYLRSMGVKPDSLVGLYTERSLDMVIGLMGILLSGGAYVPLDPDYPAERMRYMLEDAAPAIVLTQERLKARLPGTSAPMIALDSEWSAIDQYARLNTEELSFDVRPDNLAYVIYTSGSTGVPKGVMVRHSGVVNLWSGLGKAVYAGHSDWTRVSVNASFSFDSSVKQFVQLLSGRTLIMIPNDVRLDANALLRFISHHHIDLFDCTPSQLVALLSAGMLESTQGIPKAFLVGGEAVDANLWRSLGERADLAFYNVYGPAECTVDATMAKITKEETAHIGRPIVNTQIYILDIHGQLVPIGVVGEICIGGAGVARGYLNQPELTAERFIADPFSENADGRLYKTGDLGRWRADGNIEYVGRNDHQVKVRGQRIELGEIEAQLSKHAGVKEAVVIAREDQPGEKRLVAYITTITGEMLGAEELRAHLLARVPQYMVPAAFVELETLPLTPNRKVDRKALPKPEANAYASREYEPPQGEIEETLADIWKELLHIERVGRNDNFFELGGHSLLATQLISKIRGQLDIDLPLKALFERTSLAQLAQSIAKAEKNQIPPIRPADRTQFDYLPLSFSQERLWFINQLEPDSAGYNIPGAVSIRGELDTEQLERAFNVIIARHESLRTLFPSQEGRPYQQILDRIEFKLQRIDLSALCEEERDQKAKDICRAAATTPFDLATGPLIRGKVIKLSEDEHILMLNLHHIITDGWSNGILFKELSAIMAALREGRRPELPPLPIQYADYSVWQRQWLEEGGILTQQLAYWEDKLAGVPQTLDFPADYPRPSVRSFAGATVELSVDAQLTGQLKRLADQHGATLYMVLLAAFKVLLHRYTGQSDICVGSPIANRQYSETDGVIGMFVNTLALRTRIDAGETFAALLANVKATCLDAYEHQDAPFEKVVDLVSPQRNMAISPLFQSMFILQNADTGRSPDERIRLYPLESGVAKFELTAEFTETSEGLAGAIRYSTALYRPETIERLAGHFVGICRAIDATPAASIGALDYIGESEKYQLLVGYNATQADYPSEKCIHRLFAEQVAINPDKPAVAFGEQTLSYRELDKKSGVLASYLQSEGVISDSLVGLSMERSPEMVVGLLGILRAGGAYVPLDPDYPADLLQFMLEDASPAIVLTQERLKATLPKTSARIIAIDSDWSMIEQRVRTTPDLRSVEVRPEHLAYVIYTSGSTGVPKGVMIQHDSLTNYLVWITGFLAKEGIECLPVVSNLSFDASLKQIFGPLITGKTVVLVEGVSTDPEGLLRTLEEKSGTGLNCVPSVWRLLLEMIGKRPADKIRNLKGLLLGGEEIPRDLIRRSLNIIPDLHITNLYGPTEATANATFASGISTGDVSIGRPVANTQIYILDRHGRPVPIGVVGEIHIGGVGVARGYLNRPELTAERFIADPFGQNPHGRLYKSGDLGRWGADGNIEYLGRNDQQVKLRGYRIELGEIEAQLSRHPRVKEAVVIAREDEPGEKRLVAYVTTTGQPIDAEELRGHLLANVPQYMVPAAFVEIETLPLTPSRKVDRKALPKPEAQSYVRKEYEPPSGKIEEALAVIWQELLHIDGVGRNDDFFELGGHSLIAVQLMAKINRHFNQMLPLAILFTAPNIAALAELISSAEGLPFAILVPIQTDGNALPVFAVPGAGGNVLSLRALGRALGSDQPLYGLQAIGLDGKTPPLTSVAQTAAANIAALRTLQPRGPYSLIGHSYGGVVAYEMARILLEQGEEVTSLTLLDSRAPSAMQRKSAGDETIELAEACVAAASQLGASLELDVDVLRQLSDDERAQYIVGLLNDRGLEINGEQFGAFYSVYRANQLCYRTYTPQRLPRALDVSLYRAMHPAQDEAAPPDYGWNQLLQSPIDIHDVEADHFSILEKARFPEVAGTFDY